MAASVNHLSDKPGILQLGERVTGCSTTTQPKGITMLSTGTAVLEMLVTHTDNSRSWAEPDPLDEVRGQLLEMVRLSHAEWIEHLTSSGFTEASIRDLENAVSSLVGELGLAKEFALLLRGVEDVNNETELTSVLPQFLDLPRQQAVEIALNSAAFPDPITALAHVTRHIVHIVSSAVWFESARREMLGGPEPDFHMDDAQIAEGIALAEAGLAQDAAKWPPY